jgi:hypothetical protein
MDLAAKFMKRAKPVFVAKFGYFNIQTRDKRVVESQHSALCDFVVAAALISSLGTQTKGRYLLLKMRQSGVSLFLFL